MSEHDTKAGDEHAHRSLAVALTDLAGTMPDDPYRVDGVHAKARSLRKRRRATRVAGAVVVGAATIAALVAVRPGPTHVSTIPASQPSATTVPLSCDAASAAVPDAVTPPEKMLDASVTQTADAAKRAAADGATTASIAGTGVRGVKGFGTVVSAADASVTITLDEPFADQPSEITAKVSADAEFMDGASVVDVRPALNTGDPVAFAASQADDGSYQIVYLAVHVPDPNTSATSANAVDESSYVKAIAEVVGVQPGSLTLVLRDGSLASQTVNAAIGPDTLYTAGNQKCVDPMLAAGDVVGVLLVKGADGTYTVQELGLPFPAVAQP